MIRRSGFSVPGAPGPSVTALPSDADVTERLMQEFEGTHGLRLVSGVIRGCRADLRSGGSPESLENLVRSRLAALHPLSVGVGAA